MKSTWVLVADRARARLFNLVGEGSQLDELRDFANPDARVPAADVELRFWFAVFGPKGLPEPVKAKLSQAIAKVMGNGAVRERLAKLDITPDVIGGPAMKDKLEREIKNWTRFIDGKGIKAE